MSLLEFPGARWADEEKVVCSFEPLSSVDLIVVHFVIPPSRPPSQKKKYEKQSQFDQSQFNFGQFR